ncbi:uncharacterized protein EI90DRAFT_820952 [Cantharellus anzutake]|uniref:uncharacterized protein n=1 Tax=Cantharellus anzutake TaxID=1750568 RepID=UPI001904F240|nr:uncharacterized protein EI90DRAFT_3018707 [Cantharellus anzutake]XP_038923473.1 uncharacterized protein EI90DRAFT_820952 [Cantharellus anzutake]KAF8326190.1 hypothetical protein EI90DRAFT_3018707 [Cantharellus anzutake]KAF8343028.1 hypothetical protein EI90DRAFT_820952 [Cantharellus anzutake]
MRLRPLRQPQWEVTDLKEVAPTPIYYDSEADELQIFSVAPREVTGTYMFDGISSKTFKYSDALTHSRTKLMEEISKDGYNFLLMEGWSITTMRKSKVERIEVRYHAQPAVARGWQRPRTPPYLQLLESH